MSTALWVCAAVLFAAAVGAVAFTIGYEVGYHDADEAAKERGE